MSRYEGVLARTLQNILVVTDGFLSEHAPDGTLIKRIEIPVIGPDPYRSRARDLVVGPEGRVYVVNGPENLLLSEYFNGTWQHHRVEGWTIVNHPSHGCITRFKDSLFMVGSQTSARATNGSKDELLRFDTRRRAEPWQRWPRKFHTVTVGLDGLLYAMHQSTVQVFDPETMALLRSFRLPFNSGGIAVNARGEVFSIHGDGYIRHVNSEGGLLDQLQVGGQPKDIDISPSGQIVVGTWAGQVFVTDESLQGATSFARGVQPNWVAFGSLPAE